MKIICPLYVNINNIFSLENYCVFQNKKTFTRRVAFLYISLMSGFIDDSRILAPASALSLFRSVVCLK